MQKAPMPISRAHHEAPTKALLGLDAAGVVLLHLSCVSFTSFVFSESIIFGFLIYEAKLQQTH